MYAEYGKVLITQRGLLKADEPVDETDLSPSAMFGVLLRNNSSRDITVVDRHPFRVPLFRFETKEGRVSQVVPCKHNTDNVFPNKCRYVVLKANQCMFLPVDIRDYEWGHLNIQNVEELKDGILIRVVFTNFSLASDKPEDVCSPWVPLKDLFVAFPHAGLQHYYGTGWATPNPSKDNPKIEKQDSDKEKDKGNKGE